jgi:hypothetical protein
LRPSTWQDIVGTLIANQLVHLWSSLSKPWRLTTTISEAGNGWKLPTFHNTMHMVDDMCKYGKPKEANTEVGEKNHKFFAKHIGHCCRKQHKSFSRQVSVHLSDSFVIKN